MPSCSYFNKEILIVAEIGNNHEGDFDAAKEMVCKAAECGVNAVKFQVFRTEHFVSQEDEDRFAMLKRFELPYSKFKQLSDLAHSFGLLFIATPLDLASAKALEQMVDIYKIASGDNNFYPLIAQVTKTNKPIIVSTGASGLEQIYHTIDYIKHKRPIHNLDQLAVLHCVSSYPVPPSEANLLAIPFLRKHLNLPVGYSDHTIGIDAAVAATVLGAKVVEKHFTLNKNYSNFRDHHLSADSDDMRELVQRIRLVSSLLGKYHKEVQPCEQSSVLNIRRSIVAGTDLEKGHKIKWADLSWIRPAIGLPPGKEHRLIGKTLKRNVHFGEPLHFSDVE